MSYYFLQLRAVVFANGLRVFRRVVPFASVSTLSEYFRPKRILLPESFYDTVLTHKVLLSLVVINNERKIFIIPFIILSGFYLGLGCQASISTCT